jgi:hypothetical protein
MTLIKWLSDKFTWHFALTILLIMSFTHATSVLAESFGQPDTPVGFGYKTNWFAIRTDDPEAVIRAMQLKNVTTSNWKHGVAHSYSRDPGVTPHYAFVTPTIHGWVLVTSNSLVYPEQGDAGLRAQIRHHFDTLFEQLYLKFPEVQFFGTYRVVGFDAWARARNGKIERLFSYMDGVIANVGRQTTEERDLNFLDLGERNPEQATNFIFAQAENTDKLKIHTLPNEDDTVAIAGKWSLNPTSLEAMHLQPSLGFIGELPETATQ